MEQYPVRVWDFPTQYVFVDGTILTLSNEHDDIAAGDLYIAGRNTGPHLLHAEVVDDRGWIVPREKYVYPFDIVECRKVLKIDVSCQNPECPQAGKCGGECAKNF